ncbi:hypothetical protein JMN32_22505 [Fulvivirga sp. 29W222]|uniref:Uncharacterized protein n=1 Tax=Fulvivirga marina TaxID=2494733 RepID=A0A937G330_9BACT|nr:hypothetical protein [Fulvivirga marina]MBL6449100.1 hypothetical protein [Fulvivirga marina]
MMKNILKILLLALLPLAGTAQTVTTSPGVFTAEDEVTLTVDVSGTSLAGYTGDVWIWAWIAEGCSSSCDAPTNIDPAGGANTEGAKVTRDETNSDVYRITFTPVDFFGKAPSEIGKIGLKLKSQSWGDGKQSDNDLTVAVQPLVFIPSENRTFPVKFTEEDVVTLFFDQNLTSSSGMKSVAEVYAYLFVSGQNADGTDFQDVVKAQWSEVGSTPELKLLDRGDGLYSISLIPKAFFDVAEGATITKIGYIFRDAGGTVQSDTFEAFPITED